MPVIVETMATDGPGDVAGLQAMLSRLAIDKVRRLAIIGKTEGTATINDFSRELATLAASNGLRAAGGEALLARTTLIFSTGCEGVLSPNITVIAAIEEAEAGARSPAVDNAAARLAMGGARSRVLAADELVTPIHARAVADAVQTALQEADLTADQVSLVLVKSPILTHRDAAATGRPEVLARAGSSGRSRGTAALGAALALGEITGRELEEVNIGADVAIHAHRAMTFSGTELNHNEVVVLGNRPGASGRCQILCTEIDDILDRRSLKRLFLRAGCGLDGDGELAGTQGLQAVFLKAGVAPDGQVRGQRTTVFQSEVDPDKHMRAAASGLIGGLLGSPRVFVSGGAEHQAAPGRGLAACIARVSDNKATD